jgi:hemoglobin-like flavoprotein
MPKFDLVDLLAVTLLLAGVGLFAWGLQLDPPATAQELVSVTFGDWTPGLVIDGALLFILNRVIHSHERKRVISQVASLSNEFALDAVRRCRDEGWLQDGTLANKGFVKARLASADLSDAKLAGVDLSFANLAGADLTYAELRGANLKGANLAGADLRWADLSAANLDWADLRSAELDGVELVGVSAEFASVDSHYAETAEFRNAVVGGFLSVQQVALVTSSFELVLRAGDSVIVGFYGRLFETAPEFKQLFTTDVNRQARKFLQSLKMIVGSLASTERAAPVLHRLGDRHRGYGVKPEDYDVVGGVLIETLQETLGDEFTTEIREAWTAAFSLISSLMRTSNRLE